MKIGLVWLPSPLKDIFTIHAHAYINRLYVYSCKSLSDPLVLSAFIYFYSFTQFLVLIRYFLPEIQFLPNHFNQWLSFSVLSQKMYRLSASIDNFRIVFLFLSICQLLLFSRYISLIENISMRISTNLFRSKIFNLCSYPYRTEVDR